MPESRRENCRSTSGLVPMPVLRRGGDDDALTDRMIDERCHIYRTHFALDAFRAPGSGDIRVVAGQATAGVLVPRSLAVTAAELLATEMVPMFSVGRVICVFLTQGLPEGQDTRALSIALYRSAVVPVFAPSPLILPTPGNPRRCWLSPPHGPMRPPVGIVVAALSRAAGKYLPPDEPEP